MRLRHGGTGHRSRRAALAGTIASAILLASLVMLGLPGTAALFTADYPHAVNIAAGRIFRAERVTPAFAVTDRSSGSAVDGSSTSAFNDARHLLTRVWPTTFSASRYMDIELDDPLPAGLATSSVALTLRLASDLGSGSVCVYLELRRISSDALLSSHGSAGSPLACTSGSSYSALSVALSAVSSTDSANDLRVRVFGRDSASGPIRLEQAVIVGDTPYSTFALYPVLTREAFSGETETIPWGLAAE